MRAVYVDQPNFNDPLGAVQIGDRPTPNAPCDWAIVHVRAAALNRHDIFTLQGVGLAAGSGPMILGCDAAGIDEEGNEVIVHAVISNPQWTGDETIDPDRTLLSERHQGTLAELVAVPRRNLLPKPANFSFAQAACLPTAWLTAYRMLFVKSGLRPGDTVLIQGATGGVSTALISLARLAGYRIWVIGRTAEKRQFAIGLGAHQAFSPGEKLPQRVDAVMETVGEATWDHSLKSLRPGGTVVICGATSGANPPADLIRVFFRPLNIVGSTMGTRGEFESLISLLSESGVRPTISAELPLEQARAGLQRMLDGDVTGKIVLIP